MFLILKETVATKLSSMMFCLWTMMEKFLQVVLLRQPLKQKFYLNLFRAIK
ncbi:hypothetical protein GALL_200340 [mine drainage metagenome]|uniref:Uncharacterized protein n=1 Tax=mine drainage metagenome TaxID=410659 RepID=A0A1J5S1F5_9ZZZZ